MADETPVSPPPARRRIASFLAPLHRRHFRSLWLSQVASETGDWAARLALATLVYNQTKSATWSALIFVSGLIPMLGPGQLLATLADSWGRRKVMVGADLVRAAVFFALALPIHLPVATLLAMSVVSGLATAPFEAARGSAVIEVIEVSADSAGSAGSAGSDLAAAVSLTHATQDIAVLAGYAAGGSLLALVGASAALAVNGCTFLISAVILSTLPRMCPVRDPGEHRPVGPVIALASRSLSADPLARRLILLGTVAVGTGSALDALVVPLTDRAGLAWLAGPLLAAVAAVSLILTLRLGSRRGTPDYLRITAWATFAPSAVCCVGLLTGWLPAQMLGILATGGLYITLVAAGIVVGPRMPESLRATCFAILAGLLTAAQVGMSALGGLLADVVSPAQAGAMLLVAPMAAAGYQWLHPLPSPRIWKAPRRRSRSTVEASVDPERDPSPELSPAPAPGLALSSSQAGSLAS